jgi:hypothetical protein
MPYGEVSSLLLRKPVGAECSEKVEETDEKII